MDEARRLQTVYRGEYTAPGVRARRDPDHPGNRYLHFRRRQRIARMLKRHGFLPLGSRRVLDIGCAWGGALAELVALGAGPEQLYGVDLLSERLRPAVWGCPGAHSACAEASAVPFRDGMFDLVVLSTLLSSVQDETVLRAIAGEVARVLKPSGAVLWYDMRYPNPWNRHIRPVGRRDLTHLFPGWRMELESSTPLPPLVRRVAVLAPGLCPLLDAVPPLHSHYLGLLFPPAAQP